MRGYHSNTKLAFAFQLREDYAAADNKQLDSNAIGSSVIRIVEPKNSPGESLQTHPDYSSTGTQLDRYAMDSIVGVAVSKLTSTNLSGVTTVVPTNNIVRSITTILGNKNKAFDIQLTSAVNDTLDSSSLSSQQPLYRAVIEIYFSSGETEDLVLNLKGPSKLQLRVQIDDFTFTEKFPVTIPQVSPGTAQFIGYSISKAYRKLSERKDASNATGTSRYLYGIGYPGYVPFSQPFGFVTDTIEGGAPPSFATQSPIFAPTGFATTKPSFLTWFTGTEDLTRMRIPAYYGGTEMNSLSETELSIAQGSGIDLSRFFEFVSPVQDYGIGGDGTLGDLFGTDYAYEQRAWPEKLPRWGQAYGWLSTFNRGDIVFPAGSGLVVAVQQTQQNFGVPPIFTDENQIPNQEGSQPGLFWGSFFQEASTTGDGIFLQNPSTLTPQSFPVYQQDPIAVRQSKLLFGPGGVIPGHTVGTLDLMSAYGGSVALNESFLVDYNLASVRNSFCFYPNTKLLDAGSSLKVGSVRSIPTNTGASFFYSGTAGTYEEPYIPVFKGIIRVTNVFRFNQVQDDQNIGGAGISSLTAAWATSLVQSGLQFAGLDMQGMYFASRGSADPNTGGAGLNRFNGIDLFYNMLFSGHTYPRQLLGTLEDQQSPHIPDQSTSPGMMTLYRGGHAALRGASADEPYVYNVDFNAQDIVFLNSAFVPDAYNRRTDRLQDTTGSNQFPITRNHPVGHALGNKDSSSPQNFSDHLLAQNFANTSMPYAFTSRAFHAELGESTANKIPPYPYAPTYLLEFGEKFLHKNYASPTATSGYYSGTISDDGITIPESTYNTKNIAFPTESATLGNTVTGTNGCLEFIGSTVKLIGHVSNTEADLTSTTASSAVKVIYKLRYFNQCSTAEFHSGASKVTTAATVAGRIAEVLDIFPHIEYKPLAMFSALADNPFAYKTIVQDANDVDDINITQVASNEYELEIVITSDQSDIIDTDEAQDVAVPYADVWGDLPYPQSASTQEINVTSLPFSSRYISVEGEADYARHKSSYITIASSDQWATFGQDFATTQYSSTDPIEFAIHTPFIAFNNPIDETDVEPTIFGCTDSTADNFNPFATEDDGSCTSCVTVVTTPAWSYENIGLGGEPNSCMRVGVYNTGDVGSYLYGGMNFLSDFPGTTQALEQQWTNAPIGTLYTSQGAKYGGAVVTNNNYFGQTASGYISIIGAALGAVQVLALADYLENQYNEDHTAWRLKIKPVTQELLDANLEFNISYNYNNPPPAVLSTVTPVYDSVATGGTIQVPRWDYIITPSTPIVGIVAGAPYILELSLQPQNTGPECEVLNSANNTVLGLMWTSFCACGNPTNPYVITAMNGTPYEWQTTGVDTFPITPISSTCPDGLPVDQWFGDSPYPQSICFQADDQLSDCDEYWLYCIQSTQMDCANDLFTFDDAYEVGDSYFYDYVNGTITTNVEGVYNSTVNGFVWNPDIEYIVTVSNGEGYFVSQSHLDNVAGPDQNIFQNVFTGITEPGVYTVTFTFLAPYDENFSDPDFPDNNCTLTLEEVILPPDAICPEVIPGCTDETADNYDPTANYDDGTCESVDPCVETLLSPTLSVSLTSTPSSSQCVQDTIVANGATYTSTVIVPDNNGSITATVTYTAAASGTGVNNFAILILQNPPTGGNNINTIVDSVGVMFAEGTVPNIDDEASGITGIGYWSPIFDVSDTVSETFTYTQNFLAPGNYYVIAVVNPSVAGLEDCGEGAFIALLQEVLETNVGLTDPDNPCPEPCVGTDCPDYVLDCTDPAAENYNPDATFDDGSCEYTETFCEQNPTDELCIDCSDIVSPGGLPPVITSQVTEETICDSVTGSDGYCTDPNACNYNPDAALDESNNLICDYCGCIEDPTDPDCYQDDDCDPQLDPNCGSPDPECPDPGNPACDPTIFDPCPVGECGPPDDPCIILGNCEGDPNDPDDDGDPFEDVITTVEVTCPPDIETNDNSELTFDSVILQAFECMSNEGQKMMFRMKQGAYYDDTDILKLSLIAYLFNGGLNKVQLPCLFNCNYETDAQNKIFSCQDQWIAGGARFYNSQDVFKKGDIIIYYYMQGRKVTRNYYIATREIQPIDLHPRYASSGWHRCSSVTLRTADKNNIADGTEEYLQVMWEFVTRFCNDCSIATYAVPEEDENNVDPTILKNYLDPKTTNNRPNNSGILGEDGEEIIF